MFAFKNQERKSSQSYVEIPVSFFPFRDRPFIPVNIENQTYRMLLDLGSSHPLDLSKKNIDQIKKKKKLEVSTYRGIKGKSYSVQHFLLHEIRLGNLKIEGLSGFEENPHFLKDAKTWSSAGWTDAFKDFLEYLWMDGRVGWSLFRQGTCLFDFAQHRIILAKDWQTLNQEISFEGYTKIPFELHAFGILIQLETDSGRQNFLLDTGASRSILKDLQAPLCLQNLKSGSQNFGPWKFVAFPYSDFFACDGILGVDFFKENTICIDFATQTLFIKKNGSEKFTRRPIGPS